MMQTIHMCLAITLFLNVCKLFSVDGKPYEDYDTLEDSLVEEDGGGGGGGAQSLKQRDNYNIDHIRHRQAPLYNNNPFYNQFNSNPRQQYNALPYFSPFNNYAPRFKNNYPNSNFYERHRPALPPFMESRSMFMPPIAPLKPPHKQRNSYNNYDPLAYNEGKNTKDDPLFLYKSTDTLEGENEENNIAPKDDDSSDEFQGRFKPPPHALPFYKPFPAQSIRPIAAPKRAPPPKANKVPDNAAESADKDKDVRLQSRNKMLSIAASVAKAKESITDKVAESPIVQKTAEKMHDSVEDFKDKFTTETAETTTETGPPTTEGPSTTRKKRMAMDYAKCNETIIFYREHCLNKNIDKDDVLQKCRDVTDIYIKCRRRNTTALAHISTALPANLTVVPTKPTVVPTMPTLVTPSTPIITTVAALSKHALLTIVDSATTTSAFVTPNTTDGNGGETVDESALDINCDEVENNYNMFCSQDQSMPNCDKLYEQYKKCNPKNFTTTPSSSSPSFETTTTTATNNAISSTMTVKSHDSAGDKVLRLYLDYYQMFRDDKCNDINTKFREKCFKLPKNATVQSQDDCKHMHEAYKDICFPPDDGENTTRVQCEAITNEFKQCIKDLEKILENRVDTSLEADQYKNKKIECNEMQETFRVCVVNATLNSADSGSDDNKLKVQQMTATTAVDVEKQAIQEAMAVFANKFNSAGVTTHSSAIDVEKQAIDGAMNVFANKFNEAKKDMDVEKQAIDGAMNAFANKFNEAKKAMDVEKQAIEGAMNVFVNKFNGNTDFTTHSSANNKAMNDVEKRAIDGAMNAFANKFSEAKKAMDVEKQAIEGAMNVFVNKFNGNADDVSTHSSANKNAVDVEDQAIREAMKAMTEVTTPHSSANNKNKSSGKPNIKTAQKSSKESEEFPPPGGKLPRDFNKNKSPPNAVSSTKRTTVAPKNVKTVASKQSTAAPKKGATKSVKPAESPKKSKPAQNKMLKSSNAFEEHDNKKDHNNKIFSSSTKPPKDRQITAAIEAKKDTNNISGDKKSNVNTTDKSLNETKTTPMIDKLGSHTESPQKHEYLKTTVTAGKISLITESSATKPTETDFQDDNSGISKLKSSATASESTTVGETETTIADTNSPTATSVEASTNDDSKTLVTTTESGDQTQITTNSGQSETEAQNYLVNAESRVQDMKLFSQENQSENKKINETNEINATDNRKVFFSPFEPNAITYAPKSSTANAINGTHYDVIATTAENRYSITPSPEFAATKSIVNARVNANNDTDKDSVHKMEAKFDVRNMQTTTTVTSTPLTEYSNTRATTREIQGSSVTEKTTTATKIMDITLLSSNDVGKEKTDYKHSVTEIPKQEIVITDRSAINETEADSSKALRKSQTSDTKNSSRGNALSDSDLALRLGDDKDAQNRTAVNETANSDSVKVCALPTTTTTTADGCAPKRIIIETLVTEYFYDYDEPMTKGNKMKSNCQTTTEGCNTKSEVIEKQATDYYLEEDSERTTACGRKRRRRTTPKCAFIEKYEEFVRPERVNPRMRTRDEEELDNAPAKPYDDQCISIDDERTDFETESLEMIKLILLSGESAQTLTSVIEELKEDYYRDPRLSRLHKFSLVMVKAFKKLASIENHRFKKKIELLNTIDKCQRRTEKELNQCRSVVTECYKRWKKWDNSGHNKRHDSSDRYSGNHRENPNIRVSVDQVYVDDDYIDSKFYDRDIDENQVRGRKPLRKGSAKKFTDSKKNSKSKSKDSVTVLDEKYGNLVKNNDTVTEQKNNTEPTDVTMKISANETSPKRKHRYRSGEASSDKNLAMTIDNLLVNSKVAQPSDRNSNKSLVSHKNKTDAQVFDNTTDYRINSYTSTTEKVLVITTTKQSNIASGSELDKKLSITIENLLVNSKVGKQSEIRNFTDSGYNNISYSSTTEKVSVITTTKQSNIASGSELDKKLSITIENLLVNSKVGKQSEIRNFTDSGYNNISYTSTTEKVSVITTTKLYNTTGGSELDKKLSITIENLLVNSKVGRPSDSSSNKSLVSHNNKTDAQVLSDNATDYRINSYTSTTEKVSIITTTKQYNINGGSELDKKLSITIENLLVNSKVGKQSEIRNFTDSGYNNISYTSTTEKVSVTATTKQNNTGGSELDKKLSITIENLLVNSKVGKQSEIRNFTDNSSDKSSVSHENKTDAQVSDTTNTSQSDITGDTNSSEKPSEVFVTKKPKRYIKVRRNNSSTHPEEEDVNRLEAAVKSATVRSFFKEGVFDKNENYDKEEDPTDQHKAQPVKLSTPSSLVKAIATKKIKNYNALDPDSNDDSNPIEATTVPDLQSTAATIDAKLEAIKGIINSGEQTENKDTTSANEMDSSSESSGEQTQMTTNGDQSESTVELTTSESEQTTTSDSLIDNALKIASESSDEQNQVTTDSDQSESTVELTTPESEQTTTSDSIIDSLLKSSANEVNVTIENRTDSNDTNEINSSDNRRVFHSPLEPDGKTFALPKSDTSGNVAHNISDTNNNNNTVSERNQIDTNSSSSDDSDRKQFDSEIRSVYKHIDNDSAVDDVLKANIDNNHTEYANLLATAEMNEESTEASDFTTAIDYNTGLTETSTELTSESGKTTHDSISADSALKSDKELNDTIESGQQNKTEANDTNEINASDNRRVFHSPLEPDGKAGNVAYDSSLDANTPSSTPSETSAIIESNTVSDSNQTTDMNSSDMSVDSNNTEYSNLLATSNDETTEASSFITHFNYTQSTDVEILNQTTSELPNTVTDHQLVNQTVTEITIADMELLKQTATDISQNNYTDMETMSQNTIETAINITDSIIWSQTTTNTPINVTDADISSHITTEMPINVTDHELVNQTTTEIPINVTDVDLLSEKTLAAVALNASDLESLNQSTTELAINSTEHEMMIQATTEIPNNVTDTEIFNLTATEISNSVSGAEVLNQTITDFPVNVTEMEILNHTTTAEILTSNIDMDSINQTTTEVIPNNVTEMEIMNQTITENQINVTTVIMEILDQKTTDIAMNLTDQEALNQSTTELQINFTDHELVNQTTTEISINVTKTEIVNQSITDMLSVNVTDVKLLNQITTEMSIDTTDHELVNQTTTEMYINVTETEIVNQTITDIPVNVTDIESMNQITTEIPNNVTDMEVLSQNLDAIADIVNLNQTTTEVSINFTDHELVNQTTTEISINVNETEIVNQSITDMPVNVTDVKLLNQITTELSIDTTDHELMNQTTTEMSINVTETEIVNQSTTDMLPVNVTDVKLLNQITTELPSDTTDHELVNKITTTEISINITVTDQTTTDIPVNVTDIESISQITTEIPNNVTDMEVLSQKLDAIADIVNLNQTTTENPINVTNDTEILIQTTIETSNSVTDLEIMNQTTTTTNIPINVTDIEILTRTTTEILISITDTEILNQTTTEIPINATDVETTKNPLNETTLGEDSFSLIAESVKNTETSKIDTNDMTNDTTSLRLITTTVSDNFTTNTIGIESENNSSETATDNKLLATIMPINESISVIITTDGNTVTTNSVNNDNVTETEDIGNNYNISESFEQTLFDLIYGTENETDSSTEMPQNESDSPPIETPMIMIIRRIKAHLNATNSADTRSALHELWNRIPKYMRIKIFEEQSRIGKLKLLIRALKELRLQSSTGDRKKSLLKRALAVFRKRRLIRKRKLMRLKRMRLARRRAMKSLHSTTEGEVDYKVTEANDDDYKQSTDNDYSEENSATPVSDYAIDRELFTTTTTESTESYNESLSSADRVIAKVMTKEQKEFLRNRALQEFRKRLKSYRLNGDLSADDSNDNSTIDDSDHLFEKIRLHEQSGGDGSSTAANDSNSNGADSDMSSSNMNRPLAAPLELSINYTKLNEDSMDNTTLNPVLSTNSSIYTENINFTNSETTLTAIDISTNDLADTNTTDYNSGDDFSNSNSKQSPLLRRALLVFKRRNRIRRTRIRRMQLLRRQRMNSRNNDTTDEQQEEDFSNNGTVSDTITETNIEFNEHIGNVSLNSNNGTLSGDNNLTNSDDNQVKSVHFDEQSSVAENVTASAGETTNFTSISVDNNSIDNNSTEESVSKSPLLWRAIALHKRRTRIRRRQKRLRRMRAAKRRQQRKRLHLASNITEEEDDENDTTDDRNERSLHNLRQHRNRLMQRKSNDTSEEINEPLDERGDNSTAEDSNFFSNVKRHEDYDTESTTTESELESNDSSADIGMPSHDRNRALAGPFDFGDLAPKRDMSPTNSFPSPDKSVPGGQTLPKSPSNGLPGGLPGGLPDNSLLMQLTKLNEGIPKFVSFDKKMMNVDFPKQAKMPNNPLTEKNPMNNPDLKPDKSLMNKNPVKPPNNLMDKNPVKPPDNLMDKNPIKPPNNIMDKNPVKPPDNLMDKNPVKPPNNIMDKNPVKPPDNLMDKNPIKPPNNIMDKNPVKPPDNLMDKNPVKPPNNMMDKNPVKPPDNLMDKNPVKPPDNLMDKNPVKPPDNLMDKNPVKPPDNLMDKNPVKPPDNLMDKNPVKPPDNLMDKNPVKPPDNLMDKNPVKPPDNLMDKNPVKPPDNLMDKNPVKPPDNLMDKNPVKPPDNLMDKNPVKPPDNLMDKNPVKPPDNLMDKNPVKPPDNLMDKNPVKPPDNFMDKNPLKNSDLKPPDKSILDKNPINNPDLKTSEMTSESSINKEAETTTSSLSSDSISEESLNTSTTFALQTYSEMITTTELTTVETSVITTDVNEKFDTSSAIPITPPYYSTTTTLSEVVTASTLSTTDDKFNILVNNRLEISTTTRPRFTTKSNLLAKRKTITQKQTSFANENTVTELITDNMMVFCTQSPRKYDTTTNEKTDQTSDEINIYETTEHSIVTYGETTPTPTTTVDNEFDGTENTESFSWDDRNDKITAMRTTKTFVVQTTKPTTDETEEDDTTATNDNDETTDTTPSPGMVVNINMLNNYVINNNNAAEVQPIRVKTTRKTTRQTTTTESTEEFETIMDTESSFDDTVITTARSVIYVSLTTPDINDSDDAKYTNGLESITRESEEFADNSTNFESEDVDDNGSNSSMPLASGNEWSRHRQQSPIETNNGNYDQLKTGNRSTGGYVNNKTKSAQKFLFRKITEKSSGFVTENSLLSFRELSEPKLLDSDSDKVLPDEVIENSGKIFDALLDQTTGKMLTNEQKAMNRKTKFKKIKKKDYGSAPQRFDSSVGVSSAAVNKEKKGEKSGAVLNPRVKHVLIEKDKLRYLFANDVNHNNHNPHKSFDDDDQGFAVREGTSNDNEMILSDNNSSSTGRHTNGKQFGGVSLVKRNTTTGKNNRYSYS